MKPEQVQAQLTRVLSEAIAELRDPRVPMIVTVERVTVTPTTPWHACMSVP
ncbi:hypothetical protein ACFSC4_06690 [Deinococcus malanensis]|uniref:hypothetical protein n=1 Tax=Deinococcus malanensis TaxID=1706855 RepID=UPI003632419E